MQVAARVENPKVSESGRDLGQSCGLCTGRTLGVAIPVSQVEGRNEVSLCVSTLGHEIYPDGG